MEKVILKAVTVCSHVSIVQVPTKDTVRYSYTLDTYMEVDRGTIFIGDSGTGKVWEAFASSYCILSDVIFILLIYMRDTLLCLLGQVFASLPGSGLLSNLMNFCDLDFCYLFRFSRMSPSMNGRALCCARLIVVRTAYYTLPVCHRQRRPRQSLCPWQVPRQGGT